MASSDRLRTTPSKIWDVVREELISALNISSSKLDYDATFAQLGGHSLSAVTFSQACKRRGISLSVENILLSKDVGQLVSSATVLFGTIPSEANHDTWRSSESLPSLGIADIPGSHAISRSLEHSAISSPTVSILTFDDNFNNANTRNLSLIHISEPTRPY